MTTEYDALVDRPIIDAARARHAAAVQKWRDSETDLAAATAAHAEADAASHRAVSGAGGDPIEAERALHEAALRLSVAQKIRDASLAARDRASLGIAVAEGVANRGLYIAGVRLRFAAAKRADVLRAELAVQEAEHREGTRMLEAAKAAGCRHIGSGILGEARPFTEAGERLVWNIPGGFDPETGDHPWNPTGY